MTSHLRSPVRHFGFILAAFVIGMTCSAVRAAQFDSPSSHVDQAAELIAARLALMTPVGLWKREHRLPIQDPAREAQVLASTVDAAGRLGISREGARAVFALQIELARKIQERVASSNDEPPRPLRDLNSDLRPALDGIGKRLLIELYLALPEFERADFKSAYPGLSQRWVAAGITAADADLVLRSLTALRRAESKPLERVAASGVLRIGTTGDYAPFSLERDADLQGADVDLAANLATELGAQPVYVRTSWATLMRDYAAGRFDVAMSGISVTAERAAIGSFSIPYQHGGKTPIVRCGTETRFDTVDEIDQPAVRVIVNRGGTNERFARERLTHAQMIVLDDNVAVFEELERGRADVMVTDDVEVELQSRLRPALCRATRGTFTQSEKAVLLTRDEPLKVRVDAWLKSRLSDGVVETVLKIAIDRSMRAQPVH